MIRVMSEQLHGDVRCVSQVNVCVRGPGEHSLQQQLVGQGSYSYSF